MARGPGLRIAITGANGNLGRKLVAAFLSDPDVAIVRALDLEFGNVLPDSSRIEPVLVNLLKGRLEEALGPSDHVVHLAAQNPFPDASWEDASASFDMTARLAEAATRTGVRRFVFASSNHVMGGYKDTVIAQSDGGLTMDLPPQVGTQIHTPGRFTNSTPYATAKLMGERLLSAKAESAAFTAVSLRIGWCQPGENSPLTLSAAGTPKTDATEADLDLVRDLRWFRAMWLSNGDLARCVVAAVKADASEWPSRAIVVNAVSANLPTPWDLTAGRRLIGYEPADNVWSEIRQA
jgi:nucleoside-diphosphate-sugar epimerase